MVKFMRSYKIVPILFIILTVGIISAVNGELIYKWSSTIPVSLVGLSEVGHYGVDTYLNRSGIDIIYYEDYPKYTSKIREIRLKNYLLKINEEKYYGAVIKNPFNKNQKFYIVGNKKLFIPQDINMNEKDILDFIGWYVAKNGGTFAYINKVPYGYNQTLITGVVVQKVVPDKDGDYAVSIAGRNIRVDIRDDDILTKRLKGILTASKALGVNITYISTGTENINMIEKEDVSTDELLDLLNYYWFKRHYTPYFHTYYNPYSENKRFNYYKNQFDIALTGYYPLTYVEKAPETFDNDPVGGYYPDSIYYKGTSEYGYWDVGVDSKNRYYHYDRGEPQWDGTNKEYPSYWYVEGRIASPEEDSEMWDRYKYFDRWFVKNYGNALSEMKHDKNIKGLVLLSGDRTMLDYLFNRFPDYDSQWKTDLKGKVDYIVVPSEKDIKFIDGIPAICVPYVLGSENWSIHVITSTYIPPKDEDFGVYVADIIDYDTDKLYNLKKNYVWVCSFENYANWSKNYLRSSISIKGKNVVVHSKNSNLKITVYSTKLKNLGNITYPVEDYNSALDRVVLNVPEGGKVNILN